MPGVVIVGASLAGLRCAQALPDGFYQVGGLANFLSEEPFGQAPRNDRFLVELRPSGNAPGVGALFQFEGGAVTTNGEPTPYLPGTVTGIPEDVIRNGTAKQTGWGVVSGDPFHAPASNYVLEASVEDVGDSVVDSAALIDKLDVTPVQAQAQALP